MQPEVLVTVILTVYKRTEYVEVALESALAQTMANFELILADDSGSQLAKPIVERYQHDKRVVYQANDATLGIVNSIKKAIANSKGQFIAILNDDDCWEPEFLAKLSQALSEQPRRVIAFSDHWIIDSAGVLDEPATEANTRLYKRSGISTGEIADPVKTVLIDNGVPLAMAAVFRKDAIPLEMLTTEVSGAYDFWISCLLAATGRPFYFLNERLTRYRVHAQMETGRRSIDKQLNMVYIYTSLLKRNFFPAYKAHLLKLQSFFLYKAGRDNLHFEQIEAARSYFKKAIKITLDYRYLAAFGLSFLPKDIRRRMSL